MPLKQSEIGPGCEEVVLLASGARTATATSATQKNTYNRGVIVTLDATAKTDTPSIVLSIEVQDPASSKWEQLLLAAAVTTVVTNTYILYPGGDVTAAEGVVEIHAFPLGKTWRVVVTHADTDPITYSVGAILVP